MCGIAGILHLDYQTPVDASQLALMNQAQRHRGPDQEGVWCSGPVGLGHRRLSIIDLSEAARQPLINEDGTLALAFNGEIYNYQSLREDLLQHGHRFRSQSDAEVILHLYEERGIECLHALRGMFAFALWDQSRQRLFLARDRVGKKPLKYYTDGRRLVFASELKAILRLPGIPREEDSLAIHHYLTFGYCPAPLTGLQNIHKLPAGYYLLAEKGEITRRRYWQLTYAVKEQRGEEEWCEAILERLADAVRIRMVSDVPLGCFLSGGLDSSTIVALMARQQSEPVRTFSIGFTNARRDERPYAREVAQRFSTRHQEFLVEPEGMAVFPELVRLYEEPYADSSALPSYYLAKMAREHVTVALNGDGGDENFAGYDRYTRYGKNRQLVQFLAPLGIRRALDLAARTRIFPAKARNRAAVGRGLFDPDPLGHYLAYVTFFNTYARRELYTDEFWHRVSGTDPAEVYRVFTESHDAGGEDVERWMYGDFSCYLPNDLLPKVDIASMAHSLECRAPLLDHEFLEFTARIPLELKIRQGEKKYIFRKAIQKILPEAILHRPKSGFGIPIHEWFSGPMSETARRYLLDPRALARGNFRREYLERLLEWHEHGHSQGYLLWLLICLEEWRRQYIDP